MALTRWLRSKRAMSGTNASMAKKPSSARWTATFSKQRTCSSCVVSPKNVLKAMETTPYRPSTGTSAKLPIVTGIASPPGLLRSRATMASETSTPCNSTPRSVNGSAIRPVPIASSSTGPASTGEAGDRLDRRLGVELAIEIVVPLGDPLAVRLGAVALHRPSLLGSNGHVRGQTPDMAETDGYSFFLRRHLA